MPTYWTARNSSRNFFHVVEDPPDHVAVWSHVPPTSVRHAWAGALDGKSMEDFFATFYGPTYGPWQVARTDFLPGQYHPRIQREDLLSTVIQSQCTPPMGRLHAREVAASRASASNLFAQLGEVFRYIEPAANTKHTYGDQLRSLLILACTEVESAWKAILKANGAFTADARPTTNDYIELAAPMRLDEYAVSLLAYPDYGLVTPFRGWLRSSPTQTLPWYDAYNATKHSREEKLHAATLESVISAMCAVYVMLIAQFGTAMIGGRLPLAPELIPSATPTWETSEWYVPPLTDTDKWVARPLFAQPLR